MKKKIISVLLCTAMTATMLAGCGGSGEDTQAPAASGPEEEAPAASEPAAEEPAAQESAAASDEEAEIYMFIASPEYADAINELVDAYKEVAPNVTINYETTQNDYPTLLKAKLNSGEVPEIFSSTSGKEIDVYKEYSFDLSGQPLEETMQPAVASMMASPEDGSGLYGIAIKGNYFGMIYNKAIFEECGITQFPSTVSEMEAACEKISAAGYKPFTTGFNEWWVFKHVGQHFVNAAAQNAGITTAELVARFEKGEAKVSDYPELYDNFFNFIDLAVKYGDDKPLETALDGELSAFGTGKAAIICGQGAWVEAGIRPSARSCSPIFPAAWIRTAHAHRLKNSGQRLTEQTRRMSFGRVFREYFHIRISNQQERGTAGQSCLFFRKNGAGECVCGYNERRFLFI